MNEELDINKIMNDLARPFDPSEIRFKPAVVSGNRALALAYVDARTIMDRLDEVMGVAGWQDSYEFLPNGSCLCKLSLRINGEWLAKMDIGGPSDQSDDGDKDKAAVSDALKRTAVKWGISRFLYRLASQWVDYDSSKKCFVRTPSLPKDLYDPPKVVAQTPAVKPPAQKAKTANSGLPANGTEFQRRLYDYDAQLANEGIIQKGELVTYIQEQGGLEGWSSDLTKWQKSDFVVAAELTKKFESDRRQRKAS